jgi:Core binding factor beta subunit
MNELVQRLSSEKHPVVVRLSEKTAAAFKERIELGYVHIQFTHTQGGTELGVRLDREACNFTQADFDRQTGTAQLVGGLILNSVSVRCIADIDLATLEGIGHLESIEADQTEMRSA